MSESPGIQTLTVFGCFEGVPTDTDKWELLISTECFIEQDLLYEVSQFMTDCFVSRERGRGTYKPSTVRDSMRCWFLHFVVKKEREREGETVE